MERWKGQLAIVTGASTGIGEAVAERLVQRGMVVVGAARSVDKMEETAQRLSQSGAEGKFHPIHCDVRKESSLSDLFAFADTLGPLAVLVNNAGISPDAPLLSGSTEVWREMLEVNVLAYAVCVREAYTRMAKAGIAGHIVNVGSTSGHSVSPGIPNLHFYEGTKFAVRAMTEGVRQELEALGSEIRISQISPGWVHTDILNRFYGSASVGHQQLREMGTALPARNMADIIEFILASPPRMEVHDVVVRGLKDK